LRATIVYMLGPILFAIFFLLISDKGRAAVANLAVGAMSWVDHYSPLSYFVLLAMACAAMIALLVVVSWPGLPEADNPLAQYKRDHPDME